MLPYASHWNSVICPSTDEYKVMCIEKKNYNNPSSTLKVMSGELISDDLSLRNGIFELQSENIRSVLSSIQKKKKKYSTEKNKE